LNGEACREKSAQNKRDIIKVVKIDLESEENSESEDSPEAAVVDSVERNQNKPAEQAVESIEDENSVTER
jgi:hypothetical protein